MGWFLTANKNKSRSSKKKKSGNTGWDPQRALQRAKLACGIGLILTLALAWWLGESALRDYFSQRYAAPVTPEKVQLRGIPEKLIPASERRAMKQAIAYRIDPDPLDGQSLQHAAETFAQIPWVRHVHQLRRVSDGRIRVDADYRRPVAVVEEPEGYRLIDHHGILLPGRWGAHQLDQLDMPLIRGVGSAPPQRAGQAWDDQQLEAGLKLALFLRNEPWLREVKAIDASDRDERGRPRLVLRTDAGRVIWGLPPGEEEPIEPPAHAKRAWLNDVRAEHGSIDAGGQIVDAVFGGRLRNQGQSQNAEPQSSRVSPGAYTSR